MIVGARLLLTLRFCCCFACLALLLPPLNGLIYQFSIRKLADARVIRTELYDNRGRCGFVMNTCWDDGDDGKVYIVYKKT